MNGFDHTLSFIIFGKNPRIRISKKSLQLLLNVLQASFALKSVTRPLPLFLPITFAIHGGVSVAVILPAFSDGGL
jgi:hypothetical protein